MNYRTLDQPRSLPQRHLGSPPVSRPLHYQQYRLYLLVTDMDVPGLQRARTSYNDEVKLGLWFGGAHDCVLLSFSIGKYNANLHIPKA